MGKSKGGSKKGAEDSSKLRGFAGICTKFGPEAVGDVDGGDNDDGDDDNDAVWKSFWRPFAG